MGIRACAVEGAPFFQWLKPRCSSPSPSRSSSDSSSSASMASGHRVGVLGEEGQDGGGGVQEVSSMTCLPLLSRLGEGKVADDDDHEQRPVKEEIVMSSGARSDLAQSGVDLNIGLPVGGSCIEDAVMEEKDDEEEEEDN